MAEISTSAAAADGPVLFELVDEKDESIIPEVVYFIRLFQLKAVFRKQRVEQSSSSPLSLDDFFTSRKSFCTQCINLQRRPIPFHSGDEEYLDVKSDRLFPTLSRRARKQKIDELNLTRQNIHLISLGSLHLLMNYYYDDLLRFTHALFCEECEDEERVVEIDCGKWWEKMAEHKSIKPYKNWQMGLLVNWISWNKDPTDDSAYFTSNLEEQGSQMLKDWVIELFDAINQQ